MRDTILPPGMETMYLITSFLDHAVISKYPKFGTALVLGSCTIWSMHFIGMQAVSLDHVPMCYDFLPTIASLVLSVLGVWIGVVLASRDIFSGEDRVEKLKNLIKENPHVTSKMNRQRASFHIHMVALFSRLHWVAAGATMAALGALSMHYVGMIAMTGPFRRRWNIPYLVGSVVLGVAVCFAGFWILFRPLHWKVEKSWYQYRYASAMVIGLAVTCHPCGR
jgi:NO-binding membrane sensor protein with MHYT domain